MDADKNNSAQSLKIQDPKPRGVALAWRLAVVIAVCAVTVTWRLDFLSSWFFVGAILVVLFRIPRMVRLVRSRDFVSASPWLLLAAGTVAALYYQSWAKDEARARFDALAAAIEREPCRADQLLPPVLRPAGGEGGTWHAFPVGLLQYAVLARREPQRGILTVVLHLDLESAYARGVKLPKCEDLKK